MKTNNPDDIDAVLDLLDSRPSEDLKPGQFSQDEIDALLGCMSEDPPDFTDDSKVKHKVRYYDFKRPDRLSMDNIRCLKTIFDNFASMFRVNLKESLKPSIFKIHLCSIDQLTFEEYIRSLYQHTAMVLIESQPSREIILFEMGLSFVNMAIEKLCGGVCYEKKNDERELSVFDFSVLEHVIIKMLGNLRESFSPLIDLRPRMLDIFQDTTFVNTSDSTDMGVLISFHVENDELETMINFFIPYMFLEKIKPLLNNKNLKFKKIKEDDEEEDDSYMNVEDIEKTFYHIVKTQNMLFEEVKKIQIGSILPLENETQIAWREINE